jgi:hypothetical protein
MVFDILEAVGAVGDVLDAIDLFTRLVRGTTRLAERLARRAFG